MSATARWTAADVPDQRGRTAVVTGANTGLGFEVAAVLAARGATVVLACRDPRKAAEAKARIEAVTPGAAVETLDLDLASLDSVRRAAEELRGRFPRLDLLINNAGLIAPTAQRTADGFEIQLGVNHLGHFALTGLVLDRLLAVPGSRVVSVSSVAHRRGTMHFDDLNFANGYKKWQEAYGQSKLANLLFAYELDRRLTEAGAATASVAAHPGNAETDLIRHFPQQKKTIGHPRLRWATSWLFQSAPMGALPLLRAATDPAAEGGECYGPPGRMQFVGHPVRVETQPHSHDAEAQHRLWAESERLTGVTYRLENVANR